MMSNEKSIVVLNNLIEINNERIETYKVAEKGVEEDDLKDLFSEFQKTSTIFKSELVDEVQKMGGIPLNVNRSNSLLIKIWAGFKSKLIGYDREDILNTLEYTEFIAIKSYKETLSENLGDFTSELQIKLKAQHNLLIAHHDEFKKLGDLMLS
jgi:uncharacterized protein (TIGR02284 family)